MCRSSEAIETLQLHQHAAIDGAMEALKGTDYFSDAVDVVCVSDVLFVPVLVQ